MLGKGAFGTVFVATHKKSNHLCACKSIDKAKLVSEVSWKRQHKHLHEPRLKLLRSIAQVQQDLVFAEARTRSVSAVFWFTSAGADSEVGLYCRKTGRIYSVRSMF